MQLVVSDLAQAVSLPSGAQLGKYQIIRPLAIGGMAEVYLACAAGLEGFKRRVVLKRILPQFSVNAEFVTMFLNEARLTAMLDHPNIVQVHDMGNQGGSFYLTMEYVRGQDVRCILMRARKQRKYVPLGCVVGVGLGVAAGLHHAHDACDHNGDPLGIIHRDVSLSNVLVSYDGCVKVVDFGIAKAAASNSETRTGTIKGKISYMSPEQCRGEVLDRRSDVFAIGIVLYEMLTGTRLFTGDHDFAILQQILYGEVEAPSLRRPEVPGELDRIILKALRRNPDERYNTALELQRDLHDFARASQLSTSSLELAEYMGDCFASDIAAEPSDSALQTLTLPRKGELGSALHEVSAPPGCEGPVDTSMFHLPSDPESLVVEWAETTVTRVGGRRILSSVLLALAGLVLLLWPGAQHSGDGATAPIVVDAVKHSAEVQEKKSHAQPEERLAEAEPHVERLLVESEMQEMQENVASSVEVVSAEPEQAKVEDVTKTQTRARSRGKRKVRKTTSSSPAKKTWNADSALLPSL